MFNSISPKVKPPPKFNIKPKVNILDSRLRGNDGGESGKYKFHTPPLCGGGWKFAKRISGGRSGAAEIYQIPENIGNFAPPIKVIPSRKAPFNYASPRQFAEQIATPLRRNAAGGINLRISLAAVIPPRRHFSAAAIPTPSFRPSTPSFPRRRESKMLTLGGMLNPGGILTLGEMLLNTAPNRPHFGFPPTRE